MSDSDALEVFLGSRARAEVFRALMIDPTRPYYQRQLQRMTGLALRAVQRELERFSAVGLLYRRTEGRRAYYQLDTRYPLFEELRAFVLKTCDSRGRLRAVLAGDSSVRLAFLDAGGDRVLVILRDGAELGCEPPEGVEVETMSSDALASALAGNPGSLARFLGEGEDLLGRRDDVIWHWIETAGYRVRKGDDVA